MSTTLKLLALASICAALYGAAAYTRPHEPAGRALQAALRTWCPALARPELEPNEYTPRPTTQPLQTVSPQRAGYTPAELSEIYPTH